MYSLSIDYIFNRVYDVLLWIKYFWLFVIWRTSPEEYIEARKDSTWDGLRDRGWFNEYFAAKDAVVPPADIQLTLWQKILQAFGYTFPDSDGDGIPDVSDDSPNDSQNLTSAELKERYEADYTIWDKVRDFFGFGPKDTDKDGVPDSYELTHGMDPNNPDSDRDGSLDGRELAEGTNPLNNDTDSDGVIDGRDEAPLDPTISALTVDIDGDGVSDRAESYMGTDINNKDSDGDGIPDGFDSYPLDAENIGQIAPFDFEKTGLHFSIQNPVLALFADLLSIVALVGIVFLVYTVLKWYFTFDSALNDYEEHFSHGHGGHDGHGATSHGGYHVVQDTSSKKDEQVDTYPAGIANLPVFDDAPAAPPTVEDFNDHPRFAIIQGYMSSDSEALWRIGIMEADNMLLEVLDKKGYQGEGVGEKLKGASFKTIDLAWDAHKIRNRVAHEGSDFVLTDREAKRAFTLFESVFRELKAIK